MRHALPLLLAALLTIAGCSNSEPVAKAPANPAPITPETKTAPAATPETELPAVMDSPFTKPLSEDEKEMSDVPVIPPPSDGKPKPTTPSVPASNPVAAPAANAGPQDWPKQIAPFLDDTTVAIIRIDWPNADLKAVVEEAKKYGADTEMVENPLTAGVINSPEFAKGVNEMAFVLHFMEVKEGDESYQQKSTTALFHTTGAVPDEELAAIALGSFGGQIPPEELKKSLPRHGEWFALALEPENLQRINNLQPADTTALEAAVAAIGPAPVQYVSVLNDKVRKKLIEDGDIPGGQIAKYYVDKINYFGVGGAYANGPKLNVVVDTKNQEDAQELYDWVDLTTSPKSLPAEIPAPLVELLRKHLLPKLNENQLSISVGPEQVAEIRSFVEPMLEKAQQEREKIQASNNMKQIGLAFHNFFDTFHRFPPLPNRDGKLPEKPLLSWRVYLLPYLEQNALYDQFHLDEPWDSEHNIKLAAQVPACYTDPKHPVDDPGKTTFVVPSGEKAFYTPGKTIGFANITDGTSNTIMLLNVSPKEAVVWTKPDEWDYDPQNPFRGLTDLDPEGDFPALMVDGSVQIFSSKKMKPETMRNLIERNDGNVVDWDNVR
ncbi:DUF1559 domain-containing protein [Blastopirellula marina]|uniref:DUF1559 domain-containing protein n=1 Tax=Blastopirellula marina TaxID=124 RepID=A0A2S8GS44_9BACT|nr:DUF1559 domain-containing protein [Blastopirellula marina]PQO47249.1 hypothetical protein C5Y93_04200 [Blastopirellula marina]